MDTITKLKNAHNEGREKQKATGEVRSDLFSIFMGVLFRFAWPGLWHIVRTGEFIIPNWLVILPVFAISAGMSIILLRMSWIVLEKTDKRVRWAFAFAIGATTSLIIQPPTETAVQGMSLIF